MSELSELFGKVRPFEWKDIPAVVALAEACEAGDRNGEKLTEEVLRASLSTPGRDPEQNMIVVESAGGEMLATASAWPTEGVSTDVIQVSARIHPAHRLEENYAELIRWAEGRGAAAYSRSGRPVEYHITAQARPAEWREAAEHAGYEPVRYFLTVCRRLDCDLPQAAPPSGITLRTLEEGLPPLDLKHALDEAFLDHWNPAEITDEQFMHWAESSLFRPALSVAALDEDGAVAGGLVGRDGVESADPLDGALGRVEVLAVRRGYRGRGVARALLCDVFRRMQQAGVDTVALEVDAENPTGAMGLYASVGFEERSRVTVYAKPL